MRRTSDRAIAATLFAAVLGCVGCDKSSGLGSTIGGGTTSQLSTPTDVVGNSSTGCNLHPFPGPEEVYVFTDKGYRNQCRVLKPGFYPDSSNIGVPDNWISSIEIGSAVRVSVFTDSKYGGSKATLESSQIDLAAFGFNEVISSLRVEDKSRQTDCSDTRSGEVKLVGTGDCVNVTATHDLPDDGAMGIRNDSLTAVANFSGETVALYNNAGFGDVCTASTQVFFTTESTGCAGIVSSVRFFP